MRTTIYPDTNFFLHYRPITDIIWHETIAEVQEGTDIVIMLAPVVIRELDRHKDNPRSKPTRERAASALKLIRKLLFDEPNRQVRESVTIQYQAREPMRAFEANELSKDIPDDHLLASIVEYYNEQPSDQVILLTADLGLELKAQALPFTVVAPPQELRLPDEQNPEQKRIRELEVENRSLRNRQPLLKVFFENGKEMLKMNLTRPDVLTQEEKERQVRAIKTKHPHLREGAEADARVAFSFLTPDSVNDYNSRLDLFLDAYGVYLETLNAYQNERKRTIKLQFVVVNRGTCPAEDTDLILHIPGGAVVVGEEDLPTRPDAPNAPLTPTQKLSEALEAIKNSTIVPHPTFLQPGPLDVGNIFNQNQAGPRIRKTKSYNVDYSIGSLKHGFEHRTEPVFFILPEYEEAESFHLDYQISAGNMPHIVNGQLHIVVEKNQQARAFFLPE